MKTIFVITVDNIIDLITNSSSELFVFNGKNKETVREMLSSIYPEWENEYEDIKNISELSIDELDTFFSYATGSHCWPAKKSDYGIPNGFTFDELYEKELDYGSGEVKSPAWNGEYQYKLKSNDKEYPIFGKFVTEENKEELINKLDPDKSMWFLFSIGENPNWEMQERLWNVGGRYHLG